MKNVFYSPFLQAYPPTTDCVCDCRLGPKETVVVIIWGIPAGSSCSDYVGEECSFGEGEKERVGTLERCGVYV